MNVRNNIYHTILALVIFACFSSCKKDNETEETYDKETALNKWIESTMRENYLWYKDMPAASGLNYLAEPEPFFNLLLSDSDGKNDGENNYHYSYIENTTAITRSINQTEYSFGFDYILYQLNDAEYVAHLLYVSPNSPASEAGLKRGDWIISMDSKPITKDNYKTLSGGKSMELQLAEYKGSLVLSKKIQIGVARSIDDNPLHYNNTIDWNGKKVGYLVYNHFSSGPKEDDETYDNEMIALSKKFKSDGVNEFILDLRYNNGGLLSCAQLLCTILAPETALGKTMCSLEYNDKQTPQKGSISLKSSLISNGANLNLKTLYVLVSNSTASASELVINSLKPYMNVVVIGMQTEGKNVGSETYSDDKYTWKLHPIVCKIYNSANQSDYVNGFTPEYIYDESDPMNLDRFLPFGNTNELLLRTALNLISGTYTKPTVTKSGSSGSFRLKEVANSLDRKASNGVVIPGTLVLE